MQNKKYLQNFLIILLISIFNVSGKVTADSVYDFVTGQAISIIPQNPAEKLLFNAIKNGVLANFDKLPKEQRTVKTYRLNMYLRSFSSNNIPRLLIQGATFDGEFDLSYLSITQVRIYRCIFNDVIWFIGSKTDFVEFKACNFLKKINACRLQTNLFVKFNGCLFKNAELDLSRAIIGGELDFGDSKFQCENSSALNARDTKIDGSIYFENCDIEGNTCLQYTEVNGNIFIDNARLYFPNGVTIDATCAKAKGLILKRSLIIGEVRFPGSKIATSVEFTNVQLKNDTKLALDMQYSTVDGIVCFRESTEIFGCISFDYSKIENDIYFLDAKLIDKLDTAGGLRPVGEVLLARKCNIGGQMVFSENFIVIGTIRLEKTNIEGSLELRCDSTSQFAIVLRGTHTISYGDNKYSWKNAGQIILDGFVYETFSANTIIDWEYRVKWIRKQKEFCIQPYQQLANVLRMQSDENSAKKVLIAMEKDFSKWGKTTFLQRSFHWLYSIFDYGYSPWKALYYMFGFILFGTIFFGAGFRKGLMKPSKDSEITNKDLTDFLVTKKWENLVDYLIYSLDLLLPIINLKHSENWIPDRLAGKTSFVNFYFNWGSILRIYYWLHIVAGWVIGTVFVIAISGIMKQ
jgi:hypothetical protein